MTCSFPSLLIMRATSSDVELRLTNSIRGSVIPLKTIPTELATAVPVPDNRLLMMPDTMTSDGVTSLRAAFTIMLAVRLDTILGSGIASVACFTYSVMSSSIGEQLGFSAGAFLAISNQLQRITV